VEGAFVDHILKAVEHGEGDKDGGGAEEDADDSDHGGQGDDAAFSAGGEIASGDGPGEIIHSGAAQRV